MERNCNQDGDNSGAFFADLFLNDNGNTGVTLRIEKRGDNTRFLAQPDTEADFTQIYEINTPRPWLQGVGIAMKSWGGQTNVGALWDYLEYGNPVPCVDKGDTMVTDLVVNQTGTGDDTCLFAATATASDPTGDPIIYTFTASNGVDPDVTVGPQVDDNTADFELASGTWTISVTVDDDLSCPGEASLSRDVECTLALPNWKPCDTTGEGTLDLTDVINYLNYSFVGSYTPDCVGALDCDGSGGLDLTDAIVSLNYQFVTGAEPGGFPFVCKEYTVIAGDPNAQPCEVSQGCE